ncbi:hypothetical protein LLG95_12890 [bacterium]|nr:hypothetical protein [bacterium]
MSMNSIWKPLTGTQDFGVADNWDGGVPADSERALISAGAADISLGMSQSSLDLTLLSIGAGFKGSIGSASNPLELGNSAEIQIRAPRSNTLFLKTAESKTCSKLVVNGTSQFPNACAIASGGAAGTLGVWSKIHVVTGLLYVLGSAKVTDLYVGPGGAVFIAEGATVANIHNFGGRIYNNAALGTKLYQRDGQFVHQGTTPGNVNAGTFEVHGGTLKLNSQGGVITLIDLRGGVLDGLETDHENTITDLNLWYGARARLNQAAIHTNAPKLYGRADYQGPGTPAIEVPEIPYP